MQARYSLRVLAVAGVLVACTEFTAGENITSQNVVDPGANQSDEPLAAEFSLAKAGDFLDSASLQWQNERGCLTCHTNMAYLQARTGIADDGPAQTEVRSFIENLVAKKWAAEGPTSDSEVVAAATALAFHDAATTKTLHPLTRAALDRMWLDQREDGGWEWLKCGWPPMESDDHYGVTLAAIAVGVAPGDYAQSEAARQGLDKIRAYLKNNPPPTLHHRAMLVWASQSVAGLITTEEQAACAKELLALQQPDGGWSSATLGNWERGDGKPQDTKTSDGYGTGFVIYVLRQAGISADDDAIQRGVHWLKTHQRTSGRWFTRSLNRDNKHFLTHAGTAMAVMALTACDETK
ncbi:MAG: squalene--hopene cyclase [Pirellulales bacterium]